MAVLGLPCGEGFSLVVASRGYPLAAELGLLIAVTSLVEHRFWDPWALVDAAGFRVQALVMMHGFSRFLST